MKNKILYFIFLLCCSRGFLQAQMQANNYKGFSDTISIGPPPKPTDIKALCDCISVHEKPTEADKPYFDYGYEKRLMNMAGADVTKESREACTEKISKWWDKYKTLFRCQSSSFDVEKGSILKFAVVQGFAPFLETIVGTYQMDINYIDPADNRNVLDYVNDELTKAIKSQGSAHPKVNVLKEYKELLEDLGCTPSKPAGN